MDITYVCPFLKTLCITYMVRELETFHSDVEGGGVSCPGEFPPPLHHLNGVGHLLGPGGNTVELQPQPAINVHDSIGSYKLEENKTLKRDMESTY